MDKRITLLQELHDKGISFNCNEKKFALLDVCGFGGSLECVKFLVENNISTDIHKNFRNAAHGNLTPLGLAISYKHHDIVNYFREKFGAESISINQVREVVNRAKYNFKSRIQDMVLTEDFFEKTNE